jgi:hypothetical protein
MHCFLNASVFFIGSKGWQNAKEQNYQERRMNTASDLGRMDVKTFERKKGGTTMDVKTWHKQMGDYDLPAVELQHLLIEYTHGRAVALIEYRQAGSAYLNLNHPTCRAIATLALNSDIPFFTVLHPADYRWLDIVPCNTVAKEWYQTEVQMDPQQYRKFLWELRERPRRTQQKVLDQLTDTINRMAQDEAFYQEMKKQITSAAK